MAGRLPDPVVRQGRYPAQPVYIEQVAGDIAFTRDRAGVERRVLLTTLRSKGSAPKVGETWLIDRSLGDWTFAAVVKSEDAAPTVGDITTSVPGDTALVGSSEHTADAAHRHAREAWGLVGDIAASAPGVTALAGSSGREADAAHRHAREAWGLVGDIAASAPSDVAAAGSSGRVADAAHRHARESTSLTYGIPTSSAPFDAAQAGSATSVARSDHVHGRIGDTDFVDSALTAPGSLQTINQGTNYTNVPSGIALAFTKSKGTTDILIYSAITGFVGATPQLLSLGAALMRVRLTKTSDSSTTDGPVRRFGFNVESCHFAMGSSWARFTGLAAGAYTARLQINTQSLNAGKHWQWDQNDSQTMSIWEV